MSGLLPENVATLAIDFSYLLVAFLFIMGLKAMSSPSRRGAASSWPASAC